MNDNTYIYAYSLDTKRRQINEYEGYYLGPLNRGGGFYEPYALLMTEPGHENKIPLTGKYVRKIPANEGELYNDCVWFTTPNRQRARELFCIKHYETSQDLIRKLNKQNDILAFLINWRIDDDESK